MSSLALRHRSEGHQSLPHVIKFSGGRSSAAMLFMLLEAGELDRSRGDVVVFNNTSAEHPATYRFARICKERVEARGIPFLWTQFQTYEDARGGEWTRIPSYRLVDDRPLSASNPYGFEWRGEVFEEMVSWSGYVPNRFSRTCTRWLKIETTEMFLKEWLSGKDSIPRLGHHGETPRVSMEAMRQRHLRRRGRLPRKAFERKRSYAFARPHYRPEQRWDDFSKAWGPVKSRNLEHVSLLGIRADEVNRIRRIEKRAALGGRGCGARSGQSPEIAGIQGEYSLMPLADAGITRKDVNRFWRDQDWDLRLPRTGNLSNCVHCFLKGSSALQDAHERVQPERSAKGFGPLAGAPVDRSWWQRMERTYGRPARDGSWIGFFGRSSNAAYGAEAVFEGLPCDCTE